MALASLQHQPHVAELLQRSLRRGRLAHAYLFTGDEPTALEAMARNLAKVLNCLEPWNPEGSGGVDCCDRCLNCRRIDGDQHPDVMWVRPESKLRLIRVAQIRELLHTIALKPTEARWKVAILAGADRMNEQAANAFLKTLEEPPGQAVLILLSLQPERLLETVVSRCLRLRFAGSAGLGLPQATLDWLREVAVALSEGSATVLRRYHILGGLLTRLESLRGQLESELRRQSPLETQPEAEPALQDRWEAELAAGVEAEYRRQRGELLGGLEWLLRDIWVLALRMERELLALPELCEVTAKVAGRLKAEDALENLRSLAKTVRLLDSNAQEALVLESGLLRLRL